MNTQRTIETEEEERERERESMFDSCPVSWVGAADCSCIVILFKLLERDVIALLLLLENRETMSF
jgi:hypothetical protein